MFLSGPCDQQLWEWVGIWGASVQYTGEQNSQEPFLLSGQISMSAGSIWVHLAALLCLVSDCSIQCASLFFWRGLKPAGLDLLKLPQCIRLSLQRGNFSPSPDAPQHVQCSSLFEMKDAEQIHSEAVLLKTFSGERSGWASAGEQGLQVCMYERMYLCVSVCIWADGATMQWIASVWRSSHDTRQCSSSRYRCGFERAQSICSKVRF